MTMKRILTGLCISILCLTVISCAEGREHLTGTPVLKVALQSSTGDAPAAEYYMLDNEGHAEKTAEFSPDADAVFFYADVDADFDCRIKNNHIVNRLVSTRGSDKAGNPVRADQTTEKILQAAADLIDHAMYDFTVINSGGRYFVYLKLNVNWQDPCHLYAYDKAGGKLIKLYVWQSMDLLGIALI